MNEMVPRKVGERPMRTTEAKVPRSRRPVAPAPRSAISVGASLDPDVKEQR